MKMIRILITRFTYLLTFLIFTSKSNELLNTNTFVSYTANNLASVSDDINLDFSFSGLFTIGESNQIVNLKVDFNRAYSVIECSGIDSSESASTEDDCKVKEFAYCPYNSKSLFSTSCDAETASKDPELICSNNVLFLKDKGFFVNDIIFIDDFFTNHEFLCVKDKAKEGITGNSIGVLSLSQLAKDIVKFEEIYMHSKEKQYLALKYLGRSIALSYEKINELDYQVFPFNDQSGDFTINDLMSLSLNDNIIGFSSDIKFDFKSTFTYFTKEVYSAVIELLKPYCNDKVNCVYEELSLNKEASFKVTGEEAFIKSLPKITLYIGEIAFPVDAFDLFYLKQREDKKVLLLMIKPFDFDSTYHIIGVTMIKNRKIVINYEGSSLLLERSSTISSVSKEETTQTSVSESRSSTPAQATTSNSTEAKAETENPNSGFIAEAKSESSNSTSSESEPEVKAKTTEIETSKECKINTSNLQLILYLFILSVIVVLVSSYIFIRCKSGNDFLCIKGALSRTSEFKDVRTI